MNDSNGFRDAPPPPRATPAAALWSMFVVMIVALSAIVWTGPQSETKASAAHVQRCWPMCLPAATTQGAGGKSPAAQATGKPGVKPSGPSSV